MGTHSIPVIDRAGAALFGVTRQAVLRTLFSQPERRFYQRQLIRMLGLGSGAVQRELETLTQCGIATKTKEGHQTYFQANRDLPVFEELRGLVRKTFGTAGLLQTALQPLADRVRISFIYGSVAGGTEKEGSDIDLAVVGDGIVFDDVVRVVADAERETGREINPSVYTTAEFCRKLAEGQHFISSIVKGPKIFLIGSESELTGLAQIRVAQGTRLEPPGNRRPVRRRRP